MGLREHIDFHNRGVISIIGFARLWSEESGYSLPEIFEFLRVVLKKRTDWHGYVRKVDGSLYAHGYTTDKAGRKTSPIFKPNLLLYWLEQSRDQNQKGSFVAYDYCLRREDYIKLLTSERLPIPAFLVHPSARSVQLPQPKRTAIDMAQTTDAGSEQLPQTITLAESEIKAALARRTKAAAPTQQEVAAVRDRLAPIRQLESLAPSDITLTLLSGLRVNTPQAIPEQGRDC